MVGLCQALSAFPEGINGSKRTLMFDPCQCALGCEFYRRIVGKLPGVQRSRNQVSVHVAKCPGQQRVAAAYGSGRPRRPARIAVGQGAFEPAFAAPPNGCRVGLPVAPAPPPPVAPVPVAPAPADCEALGVLVGVPAAEGDG